MQPGVVTGYEPEFDFPLREAGPTQVYLFASVPRSGSTYVSHLLWATGCLGAPLEYLNFEPSGPYGYASESVAAAMLNRAAGARRPARLAPIERLSDREVQVLRLIGRGMSNREIADELYISVKTVEAHREHIKQKLKLRSGNDLLRYAIEAKLRGLLPAAPCVQGE